MTTGRRDSSRVGVSIRGLGSTKSPRRSRVGTETGDGRTELGEGRDSEFEGIYPYLSSLGDIHGTHIRTYTHTQTW